MVTTTIDPHTAERDALLERLLQSAAGAMAIFTIHVGDRLGYYEALAGHGPLTSVGLAERTGTHERYAREWLEQQTVTGLVTVENPDAAPQERRFSLPPGHKEVLAEPESLNYLSPLAQITAGGASVLPRLVNAFRTGEGISFGEYGPDVREGQARMNRSMFLYQLSQEYLPVIPGLQDRLQKGTPARIADIGCGVGWSSIGMALAFPYAHVDGFDLDEASIEDARRIANEYGVADRVQFHCRDAGDEDIQGDYDLVTALECVHDMANPVEALATMRRLAGADGVVLVMDERVGDTFTPEGNEVEGLMYGFSVLHCLPVGMAEHPSAATGTVMRTDTLRHYAQEAGYRDLEVLPIDNFFFRFYWLHQS